MNRTDRIPGRVRGRFGAAGLPVVWLLAWLVAACTSSTPLPTPLPTEYLPTAIALTIQAGSTRPPTSQIGTEATATRTVQTPQPARSPTPEFTASPATQRPSAIRTETPTPAPPDIPTDTPRPPTRTRAPTATPALPISEIQILEPGPASKVVSPIELTAYLQPGAEGKVRIELLGEDGRLLVRKILDYTQTTRLYVLTDLEFEITAVAEAARLQVITEDSYGRIVALSSVDLILLSVGDDDINPASDLVEPIVIRDPAPNLLIQGGTLIVTGEARPGSDGPLLVELIDRTGRVVGYRQAGVQEPEGTSHGTFTVEVPYAVTTASWVLVSVSERTGRIAGPTHITTVEVLLSP